MLIHIGSVVANIVHFYSTQCFILAYLLFEWLVTVVNCSQDWHWLVGCLIG